MRERMRTSAPGAVGSIAVWLNVFIPFDLSGATVRVGRGPHAGKTALDIGSALLLTDQRAFSREPGATSRMQSHVSVDLSRSEPVVTITHRCDWTIVCDPRTGEVVCRSRPSARQMGAQVVSRDPVVVRLDCATDSPCSGAPPALNQFAYRGTITYRPAARDLSLDLMVGLFPAAEGYRSLNGGAGAIIFHQAPLPIAAADAPIGARRRIRTTFADGDGSGFFPGA
jgi:hypothetical protein